MMTTIYNHKIRYELELMDPILHIVDRNYIAAKIKEGKTEGELAAGIVVYGQWEIVPETENNPR